MRERAWCPACQRAYYSDLEDHAIDAEMEFGSLEPVAFHCSQGSSITAEEARKKNPGVAPTAADMQYVYKSLGVITSGS